MPRFRLRSAARACPFVLATGLAAPAFAQQGGGEHQASLAVVIALVVVPSLQVVVAALAPAFVRRVRRALVHGFWVCLGWGALGGLLVALVAGILSTGGAPGKGLAGVTLVLAGLLALIALAGFSLRVGDWALGRWGMGSLGPVSVLVGGLLWTWACAVPVIGWAAGLGVLVAALGAGVRVVLHPGAFDEPQLQLPFPPVGGTEP